MRAVVASRHAFSELPSQYISYISCYQLSTVHGSVRGAYYMSSHVSTTLACRAGPRARARPAARDRESPGRGAQGARRALSVLTCLVFQVVCIIYLFSQFME